MSSSIWADILLSITCTKQTKQTLEVDICIKLQDASAKLALIFAGRRQILTMRSRGRVRKQGRQRPMSATRQDKSFLSYQWLGIEGEVQGAILAAIKRWLAFERHQIGAKKHMLVYVWVAFPCKLYPEKMKFCPPSKSDQRRAGMRSVLFINWWPLMNISLSQQPPCAASVTQLCLH